jgi:hypothetical protein
MVNAPGIFIFKFDDAALGTAVAQGLPFFRGEFAKFFGFPERGCHKPKNIIKSGKDSNENRKIHDEDEIIPLFWFVCATKPKRGFRDDDSQFSCEALGVQ